MRILFCFPLCVGPTTKSENLWRKLNSGQDLVAIDVVCAAVVGLFAGGECPLFLFRLLNVHIGHGHMRRPFDAGLP